MLRAQPPAEPRLDLVRREILADQPRVTRFDIHWNKSPEDGASLPLAPPSLSPRERQRGPARFALRTAPLKPRMPPCVQALDRRAWWVRRAA